MKVVGIIAEYNPFHLGHAYHIEETRRLTDADYVIVVMSGDFVQRGAPAFLSKYLRTRMALAGGADLVFELPSTHACESAEFFGQSGVELLNGLGCVDMLSFGSESGDTGTFCKAGDFLSHETAEYKELLRRCLKDGLSFPSARKRAVDTLYPDEKWTSLLDTPNNILGIEYCKAINRLKSNIRPVTVKRKSSDYHALTLNQGLPSATAIRRAWTQAAAQGQLQDYPSLFASFPPAISSMLQEENAWNAVITEDDFSLLFRWLLFCSDIPALSSYHDLSADLASRILNTRDQYENFSQYVSLLKTRELTYSRICRALFHALLGIREVPSLSYARLLGFRRTAAPVLTAIKKQGSLPIVTKLADASGFLSPEANSLLEDNIRIAHLYENVCCEKLHRRFIHEYTRQIIILP
jgi:predicted nucleotidyltransferase